MYGYDLFYIARVSDRYEWDELSDETKQFWNDLASSGRY